MRFYREEQMKKLRAILRTLLKLRNVDSFHLAQSESHIQLKCIFAVVGMAGFQLDIRK